MAISKKLLAAKRKFRGQKAGVPTAGTYDDSPLTEGDSTMEIVRSECREKQDKETGDIRPQHFIMLKVVDGTDLGRNCFPFAPYLDEVEGIVRVMRNVGAILGDERATWMDPETGEGDISVFLEDFEDLAGECVGEMGEVTVKNSKSMRDSGVPWQNIYINRGLGEDAKGSPTGKKSGAGASKVDPDDDLNMGSGEKKVTKKKAAKKKVAKKKVAKKKT